ncbi:MAG: 4-hydroxy-3-methylbut-2-enyl diphosphate reductase [Caulobacterales bacterium 68-7]|nr:4-hydroxy-3-methylbut-2-enyl diphosphate reductase [Caulobacterales bacterium]OJU07733.1 MAG: 4-hydroxy-3-methylbut-2-enyl diphosphate reductase [Caulobacterales bacterium 68-7]
MSEAVRVKPPLKVMLASPRGFCAGVDRAIQIVERTIEKYGAPVYVRHEIVHNRHVVERLKSMGAIFVEELDEAPDDRPVVFSAHGVPKSVPAAAKARNMIYLDATCPLVSKVHVEMQRHFDEGREIVLIGHAGHPEVVGAMGQLPEGAVTLIETVEDVQTFPVKNPDNLAFATQTTLSVDDTAAIVNALRERFPGIATPHKEDICYATTNRQEAVKQLAAACDLLLVIGSKNSSNSLRLVEVGLRAGAQAAQRIDDAGDIDPAWFEGVSTLGITAGASAPETLVEGVIATLSELYVLTVEEVSPVRETVTFKLPRALAS